MQVARDAVVVFGLGQQDLVGAGRSEFHGHRGVPGERGGHAQVGTGKPARPLASGKKRAGARRRERGSVGTNTVSSPVIVLDSAASRRHLPGSVAPDPGRATVFAFPSRRTPVLLSALDQSGAASPSRAAGVRRGNRCGQRLAGQSRCCVTPGSYRDARPGLGGPRRPSRLERAETEPIDTATARVQLMRGSVRLRAVPYEAEPDVLFSGRLIVGLGLPARDRNGSSSREKEDRAWPSFP